jgi:hypothetical protein
LEFINMIKYIRSPRKFQPHSKLPLLDWPQTTLYSPVTPAGQHVRRRYAVRPEIADLVADFAGLRGTR